MKLNFGTQNNNGRARHIMAGFSALAILAAMAPAGLAQCVPPPNGTMVAWYPMDELSGMGLSANLATGNFAQWSPSQPTSVAGMVGNALSFNGVDNYVDSWDSIVTNFGPAATSCTGGDYSGCTGDFTIEAWVNIAIHPSLPMAIVDKRGPGPIGYELYINSSRIGLQLADGTGYDNYDSPNLRFTTGAWHHVAVTVKRTSSIRFYFDGVLRSSIVPVHTGSLVNTAILRIGLNGPDNSGGGFVPFSGAIDELAIYNRALSSVEIQAIFNAGSNGKCQN